MRMHNHQIDRGDLFQKRVPGQDLAATPHALSRVHRREPAWFPARLSSRLGRSGGRARPPAPLRIQRVEDLLSVGCAHVVCACRAGQPGRCCQSVALRGVSTLCTIISIPVRSRAACGMHAMWTRLSCRDHRDIMLSGGRLCHEAMGTCHLCVTIWVSTFLELRLRK